MPVAQAIALDDVVSNCASFSEESPNIGRVVRKRDQAAR